MLEVYTKHANSTKGKIFPLHAVFSEMRSGISQSLARKLSDSLLHHKASRNSPWVQVKLFRCSGKIYLWHPKKGNIEKMSSYHESIRVLLGLKQNALRFPSNFYSCNEFQKLWSTLRNYKSYRKNTDVKVLTCVQLSWRTQKLPLNITNENELPLHDVEDFQIPQSFLALGLRHQVLISSILKSSCIFT